MEKYCAVGSQPDDRVGKALLPKGMRGGASAWSQRRTALRLSSSGMMESYRRFYANSFYYIGLAAGLQPVFFLQSAFFHHIQEVNER